MPSAMLEATLIREGSEVPGKIGRLALAQPSDRHNQQRPMRRHDHRGLQALMTSTAHQPNPRTQTLRARPKSAIFPTDRMNGRAPNFRSRVQRVDDVRQRALIHTKLLATAGKARYQGMPIWVSLAFVFPAPPALERIARRSPIGNVREARKCCREQKLCDPPKKSAEFPKP